MGRVLPDLPPNHPLRGARFLVSRSPYLDDLPGRLHPARTSSYDGVLNDVVPDWRQRDP